MHKIFLTLHDVPSSWCVKKTLEQLLKSFFGKKKKGMHFLSVTVVDAQEMQRLNFRFRRIRKPTDVLSFEQKVEIRSKSKNESRYFWGDLVLCKQVVEQQAQAVGHSVRQEVRVLLTHGFLHLMGYDHERSKAEEKKMAALENRLLKSAFSDGLLKRVRLNKSL